MPQNTRLDEYDKVEWYDVMRKVKPELTWDEYCVVWNDFVQFKTEHQRKTIVN